MCLQIVGVIFYHFCDLVLLCLLLEFNLLFTVHFSHPVFLRLLCKFRYNRNVVYSWDVQGLCLEIVSARWFRNGRFVIRIGELVF